MYSHLIMCYVVHDECVYQSVYIILCAHYTSHVSYNVCTLYDVCTFDVCVHTIMCVDTF